MITLKAEIRKIDAELVKMDNKDTKVIIHLTVIVTTIILAAIITSTIIAAIPTLPIIIQEIMDRHYQV